MRIGELATRTGVSVRALRYYEEQHLLGSQRSAGGQRTYADDAVDRVALIQQLYAAGLPSSVIVTLLPCVVTGIATPAMVVRMVEERDRVVAKIADLTAARERLDEIIAAVDAHAQGATAATA